MAKKRRVGGARRYYRKAKRYASRFGLPCILGLGAALYAMGKMGWFDAAKEAFGGDLTGAAGILMSAMTPANMLGAAIMPVGVAIGRKVVGPVPLVKAGRYQIRLL